MSITLCYNTLTQHLIVVARNISSRARRSLLFRASLNLDRILSTCLARAFISSLFVVEKRNPLRSSIVVYFLHHHAKGNREKQDEWLKRGKKWWKLERASKSERRMGGGRGGIIQNEGIIRWGWTSISTIPLRIREESPYVKSLHVCLQQALWWRVSLPASWDFGVSCVDVNIGHDPLWHDTPGTSVEDSDPGILSRALSAENTSVDRITWSSTSSIFMVDRSLSSFHFLPTILFQRCSITDLRICRTNLIVNRLIYPTFVVFFEQSTLIHTRRCFFNLFVFCSIICIKCILLDHMNVNSGGWHIY